MSLAAEPTLEPGRQSDTGPRPRLGQGVHAAAIALRNVLLGANLGSLLLARRPVRFVEYASESLFLLRSLAGGGPIPRRTVGAALGGSDVEAVTLGALTGDNWFQPSASLLTDLVALCLICRVRQPRTVFEIGTNLGFTAYHMALNTPPDARIYSLDLPKDRSIQPRLKTTWMDDGHIRGHAAAPGYCFSNTPEADKIDLLFGDSATYDFAPFRGRVDLFFIDGAHSYEYVRSDTLNALECCRPGSVIAWHDFGRVGVNGVTRWLSELARQGRPISAIPGGSLAFMEV